jgi:hypothetical protein
MSDLNISKFLHYKRHLKTLPFKTLIFVGIYFVYDNVYEGLIEATWKKGKKG